MEKPKATIAALPGRHEIERQETARVIRDLALQETHRDVQARLFEVAALVARGTSG